LTDLPRLHSYADLEIAYFSTNFKTEASGAIRNYRVCISDISMFLSDNRQDRYAYIYIKGKGKGKIVPVLN